MAEAGILPALERGTHEQEERQCSNCPTGKVAWRFFDGERVAELCEVCLKTVMLQMVLRNRWVKFWRITDTMTIMATQSNRGEPERMNESVMHTGGR